MPKNHRLLAALLLSITLLSSHAALAQSVDYSAFEGWPLEGRASVVTVRGQVAARDGKFVGKLGRGKLLKRTPSHF